jgi:hypothetical protein
MDTLGEKVSDGSKFGLGMLNSSECASGLLQR